MSAGFRYNLLEERRLDVLPLAGGLLDPTPPAAAPACDRKVGVAPVLNRNALHRACNDAHCLLQALQGAADANADRHVLIDAASELARKFTLSPADDDPLRARPISAEQLLLGRKRSFAPSRGRDGSYRGLIFRKRTGR